MKRDKGSVLRRARLQCLPDAFRRPPMAWLAASFAWPRALCAAPFSRSSLPSVSSFLLPIACPTSSLVLPTTLCPAPFTCSLFKIHLQANEMLLLNKTLMPFATKVIRRRSREPSATSGLAVQ